MSDYQLYMFFVPIFVVMGAVCKVLVPDNSFFYGFCLLMSGWASFEMVKAGFRDE